MTDSDASALGTPPVKLGTFDMEERDPQKSFAPLIDYVPFTAMQNVTGQPAINLPLHWNNHGLPIGVQFVGRFGDWRCRGRLLVARSGGRLRDWIAGRIGGRRGGRRCLVDPVRLQLCGGQVVSRGLNVRVART